MFAEGARSWVGVFLVPVGISLSDSISRARVSRSYVNSC